MLDVELVTQQYDLSIFSLEKYILTDSSIVDLLIHSNEGTTASECAMFGFIMETIQMEIARAAGLQYKTPSLKTDLQMSKTEWLNRER